MSKIQISFEWLSGCSGCEVSLIDLHEKLSNVLDMMEIVRLPILMDEKGYPKAKVGIVTGALRTEHDVECAKKMRDTCEVVLAFGTCAVFGGPQGAGYAHSQNELVDAAYTSNPTTTTHDVPSKGVPAFLPEGVRPLDEAITVDAYLPGCPPHPYFILEALTSVFENRRPEFGPHNICYRCDRKMTTTSQATLRRTHLCEDDAQTCFLSQGMICLGSVTLDRCLAPCPKSGTPCTGCAGPSEHIILEPQRDVRTEIAQRMSMLTKIPKADIIQEVERRSKTHYAYAMASSVFRQKPTFLLRRWIAQSEGTR